MACKVALGISAILSMLLNAQSVSRANTPAASVDEVDPLAQVGKECGLVRETEYADGAQTRTPIEKLRNYGLPGVWSRKYVGDTVTVAYFCNSPHVDGVLILWEFDTLNAAKAAYARYVEALTERFGPSCWDSHHLDSDQRARLAKSAQTLPETWTDRVDWNVRPHSIATLHHSKFDSPGHHWSMSLALNSPAMFGHSEQTDIGRDLYHIRCRGYDK